ncbi:sigma 54-interacting transcriptional regulator [Sporosarcina thermotolerans]|nr:sigma 54-interacting transcriptional regulator [Sporosarcina thermotolerans]WHT49947.1 sigma 54-interacting transcriptional regulator [Sporosarcina thermotolerans]
MRVNCSAIDPSVIERELFGEYDQDSSKPVKSGLFDEAFSGSIFLDEVTDLPLGVQLRLLDHLKERTIQMNEQREFNPVRIIAATSKNLEKAIHEGSFNIDLYYALNRITIQIPSLRNRKADIPEIAVQLLKKLNQEFGMNVGEISDEAMNRLQRYEWPGNVRELENVLSRAMIYIGPGSSIIQVEDIRRSLFTNEVKTTEEILPEKSTLASVMDDYERSVLEKALDEHNGNKSLTANRLGISLRSLYYKLEKFKLI